MTAAANVFTDAWPAAWAPAGVTRDGSQFSYEVTSEGITVAEYLDVLDEVETSRSIGVAFDLAHITDKSYALAFNGISSSATGTGAATVTKLGPPVLGASVKTMLGWESQDSTQRAIFYQCLQSGNIQFSNQKAPNFQSLPLTFKVSQPTSGDPFNIWLAGTNRLAAA
ncbi:hypothetical protein [Kineosporia sp. NBRC 101731]|uniref:hypothetical protein n=1 Tax=Kineosporia sp. NBRC 101731 TaxID=3032199 RepID=UPI002553BD16|nr:hypothetical protein [Kineosporia sp. NBRC 101731]